jgi:mono/diheme cytochrome c family protein
MTKRIILLVLAGIATVCAQSSSQKAPPRKPKADAVNYFRDIEPILKANCESCHHAAMAAGGLRVDAPENVLQGGASGPSVVPKKAERSLLYTRLTDTTAKRMPPADTLSEEQLALIRAWINLGAKIEPLPKTNPAKP